MEKRDIEKMKKMSEALDQFSNAWYNVRDLWDEQVVADCMSKTCDLYPFDRSFDEMECEVGEWAYISAMELQKKAIEEEQWNMINEMELSTSCIQEIIDNLHKRFHEEYD